MISPGTMSPSRGIPVSCEVDIYGALSEFIGEVVSDDIDTLLDINNTVPADIYNEDIAGRYAYTQKDTFMGFHCGNTCSKKLASCEMKNQMIMARSLSVMSECNRSVMRIILLDQNVTVETSHLMNGKYANASERTGCNQPASLPYPTENPFA